MSAAVTPSANALSAIASPPAARPAVRGAASAEIGFREALDRAAGLDHRPTNPNLPPPCPAAGSAQDGCAESPSDAQAPAEPQPDEAVVSLDKGVEEELDAASDADLDVEPVVDAPVEVDAEPDAEPDDEASLGTELHELPGETVVRAPVADQCLPNTAPTDLTLSLAPAPQDACAGGGSCSESEAAAEDVNQLPVESDEGSPRAIKPGEARATLEFGGFAVGTADPAPPAHRGQRTASARAGGWGAPGGATAEGSVGRVVQSVEGVQPTPSVNHLSADPDTLAQSHGAVEPLLEGGDAPSPSSPSGLGSSTPAPDAAAKSASAGFEAAPPPAIASSEARINPTDTPQPQPQPEPASPEDEANLARTQRGLGAALRQQGGSVTLRLTPAELGTIRIEMRVSEGTVVARLTAEHESAHALLSRNLGELKQSLQARGLLVERLEVATLAQPNLGASGSDASGERGAEARGRDNEGRSRGRWDRGGREDRPRDRARPAWDFTQWLENP